MCIEKELTGITLLIKKISGRSTSVIYATHINKVILCPGINDANHISEEIGNSLDGQSKISVEPILYKLSAKIYFSAEFQTISNIFLFSPSRVHYQGDQWH
jgi:hypothetical protein